MLRFSAPLPLATRHVPQAAAMAAARCAALRARVPEVPPAWSEPAAYEPLLRGFAEAGASLVMEREGRVAAYLAAWKIEARGEQWVFSPEWGNGSGGADRRGMIEELYRAAAADWMADGRAGHHVSLFADDGEAREAWAWLGFGATVADGLRGVEPISAAVDPSGLVVRRAGVQDAERLAELEEGLRQHLAASPVFFRLGEPRPLHEQQQRLSDAEVATWLAEQPPAAGAEAVAVAYLRIGPSSDDAATIIRAASTASITGAFTLPELRGTGVGTALLQRAVAWARTAGYERVAVDHETANLEASRFWRRHFAYVTHTVTRRV
jgi:GNAT superfamily N-acetyltransferase